MAHVARWAVAPVVVAIAYALQRLVWPYVPPSPHLFFYPAVFVVARASGLGPGVLATLLSIIGIAHGFLPPEGLLAVRDPSDLLDLLIFGGVGVGVSIVLGRLARAIESERAAAAEARRVKESTDATWSMIAHDLRAPLQAINLSSSLVVRANSRGTSDAIDVEKAIAMIQRSTDRARALLEDALDAMRSADGKLRVVPVRSDVRRICARVVEAVGPIAARKGVALAVEVDTEEDVLGDPPRLEQVLTNLVGNAIKFTAQGGSIVLDVRAPDPSHRELRFCVTDTGAGIAPDAIGRIFSKFWTDGSSGGLGLGLWIASAILAAHGSKLDVSSRVGEGTTFSFVLPAVSEADASAPRGASSRAT